MAPRKSTTKRKPKPKQSSMWGMLVWWVRPSRSIPVAAAIFVFFVVPVLGSLLPKLTDRDEYQFPVSAVEVNEPHAWAPKTLLSDVFVDDGFPETVSLLDPELAQRVSQAFDKNPWVERVNSVTVSGQPSVRAFVKYREPVALIRQGDMYLPIDRNAVLLPAEDFSLSDQDRLPIIENVHSKPNRPGERWPDVVVVAAAQLAEQLTPNQDLDKYWRRFQLKSIVAPSPANQAPLLMEEIRFELATTTGSRILWGRPPGADHLEPNVEQKIARLNQYLSRFGSFDKPDGPYRIDIRLFDAIALERIAGNGSTSQFR